MCPFTKKHAIVSSSHFSLCCFIRHQIISISIIIISCLISLRLHCSPLSYATNIQFLAINESCLVSLFADGGDFYLVEILPYNFPAPLLLCVQQVSWKDKKKNLTQIGLNDGEMIWWGRAKSKKKKKYRREWRNENEEIASHRVPLERKFHSINKFIWGYNKVTWSSSPSHLEQLTFLLFHLLVARAQHIHLTLVLSSL